MAPRNRFTENKCRSLQKILGYLAEQRFEI